MNTCGRTIVIAVLAAMMLVALPARGAAQTSRESPEPDRDYTVLAGVGNALGWLGVQVEKYFAGDRLSIFGGLGYTPGTPLDSTGLTAAAGVRGYTAGDRHRGLLEISVSQLGQEDILERGAGGRLVQEGARRYGPALTVGYQFVAGSGFTAVASGGVGLTVAQDDRIDESPVTYTVNLGLGYTFR